MQKVIFMSKYAKTTENMFYNMFFYFAGCEKK